ncbi:MAG: class II histone deacetylase, partial [Mesorhizobium sp.]
MNLHSDSYRTMMASIVDVAGRLCQGHLVVVHEGGYSETYVPFCGHALVEALSGETSDVVDPLLPMALQWQPAERFNALQFEMIDEMAASLKL